MSASEQPRTAQSACLALLLLGLLFSASTAAAQPAAAQPPLTDFSYRVQFKLSVPPTWEMLRDIGMMRAIARSPLQGPEDQFQENVNVIVNSIPRGVTLEEYGDYDRSQLLAMAQELEFSEEGAATIGGHAAIRRVYSQTINDRRLRFLQYSILKDTRVYTLTGTASVGDFEAYVDVFESIIQSFVPG